MILGGCGSVGRDIDHMAESYEAAPVPIQTQSPDGPVTIKVRPNKAGDRVIALLDTGAFRRALAKDLGQPDTSLPEDTFRSAANQYLKDAKKGCSAGEGLRRQDYLWEFGVLCR
jgi:hypothetical protein